MAENKTFNVRLKLKYDSHENWLAKDPVLLAGEAALVTVSVVQEGKVNAVPETLMKVGDGTHKYSELDFISAKAADVYSWAKAKDKPTYAATEITGIDAKIADYVSNEMGIQVDTDTQYNITKVNDYQYKLMSKSKGDESFAIEVATIDIPNDTAAITALQSLVGSETVAAQIATALTNYSTTEQMNTAIATARGEAVAHANSLNTAMNTRVEALEAIDHSHANAAELDKIAEGDVVKWNAAEQNAKDYADGLDEAMDTRVLALEAKFGDGEGNVEAQIAAAVAAEAEIARAAEKANADAIKAISDDYLTSADETALQDQITANANAISNLDGLVGDAAVTTQITNVTNPLDARIKAIEDDYLTSDDKKELTDADADQVERIAALEGTIVGLSGAMHFEGVVDSDPTAEGFDVAGYEKGDVVIFGNKEYVFNDGAFVEFGDVSAQAEAITDLTGRMTTAEGEIDTLQAASHTHANKTELDKIADGDKAKWDDAAAKAHEHANKAELDLIVSGDKAKWDAGVVTAGEAKAAAATNASAISELETKVGEKPVAEQIITAIANENLAQYAKAADLTSEVNRAKAAEEANATAAAAAKTAADDAQADVDALTERVDALKIEDLGQETYVVFDCGSAFVNI